MTHCDGDDTKQGLTNADLQLQLIAPEGERRSFALRNVKTFTVGRDEKCTVVLKGSDVSRRHADFRVHENGLTVVDRSQNGTWVDGVLIKRANHKVEALACRVEIGHHVLELLVTPRQKPRTSPALAPIPGGKEDPAG
ncbi:MAG TPA: FHA domain-containing protein, partial [Polyangiaceae bacterium]|nr:FHA domain-containing protein [Polyangiaceae bacterium]